MSDRGLLEPQRLGKEAREDAEREAPGSAEIMLTFATVDAGADSPFAWRRLGAAVALATIGSVGTWSVPVVLPSVQAAFGVARGDASLPFTLTMIGFGFGGVVMGRLADHRGIVWPITCGTLALGCGYVLSGFAGDIWQFALAQGLIGFGSSAMFGPLMSDISHWF